MKEHNFYDKDGKLIMSLDANEPIKEVMRFDIDGSYQSSLTPIQWTAVGSLDANGNGFLKMGKEMMTIHHDGRITVSEDASPTETAKLVLEAMQEVLQGTLQREYERGYRDGYNARPPVTDSATIRKVFEDDSN